MYFELWYIHHSIIDNNVCVRCNRQAVRAEGTGYVCVALIRAYVSRAYGSSNNNNDTNDIVDRMKGE